MKKDALIHVYCMPGLAANPTIFENIRLPKEKYEIHWLSWLLPGPRESLKSYASRIAAGIVHDNPVLLGVSFGGVIVQEVAEMIRSRRVIIISSVKTCQELPRRMRFSRSTGIFRFFPTSLVEYVHVLQHVAVGDFARKRLQLYQKYLSITDTGYLDWALEQMICFDRKEQLRGLVHIHGDKDLIFPYKYIKGCITVPGGTHVMIVNRFRWFNQHLDEIITTGELKEKKKSYI